MKEAKDAGCFIITVVVFLILAYLSVICPVFVIVLIAIIIIVPIYMIINKKQ